MAHYFGPVSWYLRKTGYRAMTLWPFIFVADDAYKSDAVLMKHECIHLRQQREMLVLPFYAVYLYDYFRNRASGMDHDTAYRNIRFENEAYEGERESDEGEGRV